MELKGAELRQLPTVWRSRQVARKYTRWYNFIKPNTYGYDNTNTSISLRGKGFRLSRAPRLYSLFVCCANRILNDLKLSEEWPIDIKEANMDARNEKETAKGPMFWMMPHSRNHPLKMNPLNNLINNHNIHSLEYCSNTLTSMCLPNMFRTLLYHFQGLLFCHNSTT